MPNKAERLYIENKKESGKSAASMLFTSWRQKVVFYYCPGSKQIQHVSTFAELNVCMIHSPLCLMVVFPLPPCSVLWLDVLSITGGRRLSAYGCQNGCVGLALVNQTGPGNGSLRFREVWLPGHLFTHLRLWPDSYVALFMHNTNTSTLKLKQLYRTQPSFILSFNLLLTPFSWQ